MNLENVTDAQYGSVEAKGIDVILYIAYQSDVLTFPAVPAVPTTLAESVTITSDIVFNTGKCFKKIQARINQSMLETTSVGETESKSFNSKLTFSIPTNHPTLLGFCQALLNRQIVMVAVETCGQQRLFGGVCNRAYVDEVTITSGQGQDSFKGATIVVDINGKIVPVYEGAIPLTPAA